MRRGGGCAEEEDAEVRVRVLHAYTALSRILNGSAMYGSVKTSGSCAGYGRLDIGTNYQAYDCPTPLRACFGCRTGGVVAGLMRKQDADKCRFGDHKLSSYELLGRTLRHMAC